MNYAAGATMSATMVGSATDLSWVTFADHDDERPCEWYRDECSRVAVWRAIIEAECDCELPTEYCDAHRDEQDHRAKAWAIVGLWCAQCQGKGITSLVWVKGWERIS